MGLLPAERVARVVRAVSSALLCVVVIGLSATASEHSDSGVADRDGGSATQLLAVVYRGPAGCPGCSEAVAALLRLSALDFAVSYIGPGEKRTLTAANLRGVDLYAQPGGDGSVDQAVHALGRPAARAIENYVAAGGHYVGFCMGAYLAGSDPGMELLAPGDTGQYSKTPGAEVTAGAEAVVPVRWGRSVRYQYAQDPAHILSSSVPGERVLSRFTNGTINALVRPYRDGRVGVVGTHPEADRSWYADGLWRDDRDGLDHAQGLELIAATMTS